MNLTSFCLQLLLLTSSPSALGDDWPPKSWTEPTPPFRIAGPVYYVGSRELTAYLLVDEAGSVLINIGMETNVALVLKSIRTLGFDPAHIRYLLITQAHYDHGGGAAKIRELTGAEILVGKGDVDLMNRGGMGDYVFGDDIPYTPVAEIRGLSDGEEVTCGRLRLKTLSTPGHTPGSTSWLLEWANEGEAPTTILFQASISVLYAKDLFNNPRYPTVIADYRATFKKLGAIRADIVLPDHMVFAHPQGKTHDDTPQASWFRQPDLLQRQLKNSRTRLEKFIKEHAEKQ